MRRSLLIASSLLVGACYTGQQGGLTAGADASDSAPSSSADGGETEGDDEGETEGPSGDEDPGNVILHRLNRVEYNNTVRDLFYGLDVNPADTFPADDHSFGFDNIASVLSVTPLLLELYERAAEQVIDEALFLTADTELFHNEAEAMENDVGSECCNGMWNLFSNGEVFTTLTLPADGSYEIRVRAAGQQAGPDLPNMEIVVDGQAIDSIDVDALEAAPAVYTVTTDLTEGAHVFAARFTNDYSQMGDRNLLVDWVEVEGPMDGGGGGVNPIRDLVMDCSGSPGEAACADEIIARFAERAWRRPLEAGELEGLTAFVQSVQDGGGTWEEGIKTAMKAAMISPHFIFRVEIDPDPESTEPHKVGEYEMASRLSYFLWSSMPDDELFELAANGELNDKDVIEAEVTRMLEDPKADQLIENFAGQWLYTRALTADVVKDSVTYPDYTENLRVLMRTEMELFIESFLTEGRSLQELLTAKETYVNDELAAFYGIDPPGSSEFQKVQLDGVPRQGLLTQAGLMTVLSHPNVTSPVKRGKWIMEQLMCTIPPPPPGDVEIPPLEPGVGDGPMRERLAEHRENPQCAGCHALMDPIGLALEHYDGIGAYRDKEGEWEIDPSGELPMGGEFADAFQMANLVSETDEFARCLVQQSLIYGLGRGMRPEDDLYLDTLKDDLVAANYGLKDLIVGITTADVFRYRRGGEN